MRETGDELGTPASPLARHPYIERIDPVLEAGIGREAEAGIDACPDREVGRARAVDCDILRAIKQEIPVVADALQAVRVRSRIGEVSDARRSLVDSRLGGRGARKAEKEFLIPNSD